jgi:hypothetical protein
MTSQAQHTATFNAPSIAATFRRRRWPLEKWADSHSPKRFCERLANADPTRYERAALRWLQRFIDERLPPLSELALAACASPNFVTETGTRASTR